MKHSKKQKAKLQTKKKSFVICALAVLMMAMMLCSFVAIPAGAATVREADVSTASSGCTMLGIKGSFNTDTAAAIARINEIRKEACDNGYKNPSKTGTNLKPSDYKPIQWSQALELIARMRAAESSMTGGHKRLNGKDIWGVTYGGISSSGECLAWHGGDDVIQGINQWYEEKVYWTTSASGVTGHYEALIDPNNLYIGLGNFFSEETHYGSCLAGEFSSKCGSLGSTPLAAELNITQKVEVKDTYYTKIVDCDDKIGKGSSQMLTPKAKVAFPGGYATKIDFLYNTYTYQSSNTSVGTVSATGLFTAKAEGTTTITIKSGSTTIASKTVTVGCPHDYEYTQPDWFIYSKKCSLCGDTGDYSTFKYAVYWGNDPQGSFGTGYSSNISAGTVTYVWPGYTDPSSGSHISKEVVVTSSNDEIMTVTKNGYDNIRKLEFKKAGIVKLTITPKEDPKLGSSYVFRVPGDQKASIADATMELSQKVYTYDKKAHTPTVTVTYDGIPLVKDTDYTLSYADNTEGEIARAVITGKGIFAGTKEATFLIEKKKVSDATISLAKSVFTYSGKENTPAPSVTYEGTKLVKDTDYTVTYEDNTDVGTAKAIINGIGMYAGTVEKTFEIKPMSIAGSAFVASCNPIEYNGEAQSPEVAMKWGDITLVEGSDFEVQAVSKTEVGSCEVVVTGTGNYTGSKTVAWSIVPGAVTVETYPTAIDELEYDGNSKKLIQPGVVDGGKYVFSLEEDGVYSEEIPVGTDAGVYTVYYKVEPDENHVSDVTGSVQATIGKIPATLKIIPAAKDLFYNAKQQILVEPGESSDGTVAYSLNEDGTYSANLPTQMNAGTYDVYYKVVGDDNHFDTEVDRLIVTINKAVPEYTIPTGLIGACDQLLSEVILPDGFDWNRDVTDTLFELADESQKKVAGTVEYIPEDTDNYENVTGIPVEITVSHDLSVASKGDGYHSEHCMKCEYERNIVACSGGTATCTKKAMCSVCEESYGDIDGSNHVNTVVQNKMTATCVETGYTGDTYCKDCEQVVVVGKTIEKDLTNHTGTTTLINQSDATCKRKGYTGDVQCDRCKAILEVGETIPVLSTHSYVNGVCSVCEKVWEVTENGVTYRVITKVENGVTVGVTIKEGEQEYVAVAIVAVDQTAGDTVVIPEEVSTSENDKFVVTEIVDNAFYNSGVFRVVLPSTIKELGMNAMSGVSSITFGGSNPPEGLDTAIDNGVSIQIPEGARENFEAALDGMDVSVTEVKPECQHDWSIEKIIKQPTTTSEGLKQVTCSLCGETKEVVIDKLTTEPSNSAGSNGNDKENDNSNDNESNANIPQLGVQYVDGKTKFVITNLSTKEAQYVGCTSKSAKTITIPATVNCEGMTFKVTSVKAKALKGYKKVTKIVVGKNVKKIGSNAFSGCKKLKTLTIKSKKLTSSGLAKKAFAGITKKPKVVVPKSKLKTYKKLFKKKGLAKSVKVTA